MLDNGSPVATLVKLIGAVVLVSVSSIESSPRLLWNGSKSVPVGLYVVSSGPCSVGKIAALRLPPFAKRLAARRRYLPANAVMLKPVAAMPGDRVCRWQRRISINGQFRAEAARHDSSGRLMPIWQGCQVLRNDEIFVLSTTSGSFDSRYFGPIRRDAVIGIAKSLVIF